MLACLALAGCDSINWPHIYGPDEIPQSVRDEPRAVPSPPPEPSDESYPRLGDVPSKPKDFTPAAEIDQTKQQMENDRVEGEALRRQNAPAETLAR